MWGKPAAVGGQACEGQAGSAVVAKADAKARQALTMRRRKPGMKLQIASGPLLIDRRANGVAVVQDGVGLEEADWVAADGAQVAAAVVSVAARRHRIRFIAG